MANDPHVFTIPASAPFLPVLIGALLRRAAGRRAFRRRGDPLQLARATLYLPTRRACRLARDLFLDALDGDAAILPRIVPLGDIDEDELAFAEARDRRLGGSCADAAAGASSALERRLLLAELICNGRMRRRCAAPPARR